MHLARDSTHMILNRINTWNVHEMPTLIFEAVLDCRAVTTKPIWISESWTVELSSPSSRLLQVCGYMDTQWAPLDLNLGPSELSEHRWTSTWDPPSSVSTAGPQRPDRTPEDMPDRTPDRMSERMPEDMPNKVPECLQDDRETEPRTAGSVFLNRTASKIQEPREPRNRTVRTVTKTEPG